MPNEIHRDVALELRDEKVSSIRSLSEAIQLCGHSSDPIGIIDARDAIVVPGFIDVHVHGAIREDVMRTDAVGLKKLAQFFAQHGVTGFLPTTMTSPPEKIMSVIKTVKVLLFLILLVTRSGSNRARNSRRSDSWCSH